MIDSIRFTLVAFILLFLPSLIFPLIKKYLLRVIHSFLLLIIFTAIIQIFWAWFMLWLYFNNDTFFAVFFRQFLLYN